MERRVSERGKQSSLFGRAALLGIGGLGVVLARRYLFAGGPGRISRTAKEEFVDKCTARWLFEKTGVHLYDRLLEKCPEDVRERLQHFRDEEKEHEEMLEDIIRKYGADPHAQTVSSRITDIESKGIVEVVENEDYDAALDAMLAAELVDNANWDLLIKLARRVGDVEAVAKFGKAMVQEAQHLFVIRKLLLNETVDMMAGRHQEHVVGMQAVR